MEIVWLRSGAIGEASHTRVTFVGVLLDGAFGDFEVLLAYDLVHGVLAAAEDLARIAVAVVGISAVAGSGVSGRQGSYQRTWA